MEALLRCLRPALTSEVLHAHGSLRTWAHHSFACMSVLATPSRLPTDVPCASDRRCFASEASPRPAVEGADSPAGPSGAKPELVERFLGLQLQAKPEQLRRQRLELVRDFQRHQGDTGSPEVTVAVWTQRIRELANLFQHHRKNYHQMRKLELMFNRRRRLLTYLRKNDFEAYCFVVQKLGLKDVYAEIRGDDRYSEGTLPDQPTDDRVLRHRFAFHPEYRQKKTNLWKRLRPKLVAEDPSLSGLAV